ncbi:MAG: hypothetical protein ACRC41_11900 [Sarcina sp.]
MNTLNKGCKEDLGIYKVVYDKNNRKVYEGEFEGDYRDGRGSIYYENGNVKYSGEWKADSPHGIGALFYENGFKFYEGRWCFGSACGQGILFNETGKREYEGHFNESKKNGMGTMYFEDGSVYKGEWVDDKREGFGSLYYPSGELKYRGTWKDSKKEGYGTLLEKNNIILYQGEFKNGFRDGTGKSYYGDGILEYDGEWQQDEKAGEGILYNSEGEKIYEGFFSKGKKLDANVMKVTKDMVAEKVSTELENISISIQNSDGENIIDESKGVQYRTILDYEITKGEDEDSAINMSEKEEMCEEHNSTYEEVTGKADEYDLKAYCRVFEKSENELENTLFKNIEHIEENEIDKNIVEDKKEKVSDELEKFNECLSREENEKLDCNSDEDSEITLSDLEYDEDEDIDSSFQEDKDYIRIGEFSYKGIFEESTKTGIAKVFFKEKIIYDGMLVGGFYEGEGTLYDDDERISYIGQFEHGKREGKGTSYDVIGNIIYEGLWKDDLQQGKGRLLNSNGEEIYNGMFYEGKALGLGNSIEEELENILYCELESMVGLEEVKDDIARLVSFLKMQILRQRVSYKVMKIPYVFTFEGNIGVGKEAVARILGKIYYILGLIPEYNFLEKDLISALEYSHEGEIEKNMEEFGGGVLYLSNLYQSDYDDIEDIIKNKEATNNLLNLIEFSNGHFIIIFSGDEELIEFMIHSKKELAKLVGKSISFFDYSIDEMIEYIEVLSKEQDYIIEHELFDELEDFFSEILSEEKYNSRNGEFLKELFTELVKEQCIRIDSYGIGDVESLKLLKLKDFENVKNRICF